MANLKTRIENIDLFHVKKFSEEQSIGGKIHHMGDKNTWSQVLYPAPSVINGLELKERVYCKFEQITLTDLLTHYILFIS